MKTKLLIFLISAFAILWQSPSVSATLTGRVTDQSTGRPIDGVKVFVWIDMRQACGDESDRNGSFIISGIPEGKYLVSASKEGYSSQIKKNVEIAGDSTTICNFQLRAGKNYELFRLNPSTAPMDNMPLLSGDDNVDPHMPMMGYDNNKRKLIDSLILRRKK